MISLSHIAKQFEQVLAVDDLSIDIHAGRICGFLGPNGAGKTTSIRMLMHIIQPDRGDILFDGLTTRPPSGKIGYLPEERGLYQKISLLETLQYFAHLRNVPDADRKIHAYLDRFDLGNRAHSKVSELSKGNQQKVQFINTILHDPKFVVLDEPFSGLDPVNQILLKEILEEMRQAGKTIIFSSHQMDQVEKICDDVALINAGKLVLSGDLKKIKANFGSLTLEVIPHAAHDLDHAIFRSMGADVKNGIASIPLDGRDQQKLITEINSSMPIRSIRVGEPGLEDIFIQQVGGDRP